MTTARKLLSAFASAAGLRGDRVAEHSAAHRTLVLTRSA